MTKKTKAILAACGIGAAGYAVCRSRKPKRASDIWNFYAPVYNTFMRMDRALYEEIYRRIRSNALHIIPNPEQALAEIRRVLRPDGMLIAPNFVHREGDLQTGVWSKLLTAAGIVFAVEWDADSYPAFLERNGWRVREKAVLEASIPLVYAECEATEKE